MPSSMTADGGTESYVASAYELLHSAPRLQEEPVKFPVMQRILLG